MGYFFPNTSGRVYSEAIGIIGGLDSYYLAKTFRPVIVISSHLALVIHVLIAIAIHVCS